MACCYVIKMLSMCIWTYHTAKEGLKQFEELKVRFENEYHLKEEKVSAHVYSIGQYLQHKK